MCKHINIWAFYSQLPVVFSHAKLDLYKRGLKAFFKLKSIFGNLSPNVNTSLHVFDHAVKPVLLYGYEV